MAEEQELDLDRSKLIWHPARVASWGLARVTGSWYDARRIYPIYVEVSPVGACPHRCTFCGVMHMLEHNEAAAPILDGVVMRSVLSSMAVSGVRSVMFAGEGEPLLHKQTNANILTAKQAGLDVAVTTNGVLLDKLQAIDLCSWVKVSVNAGTKATYAKVHRTKETDWDRVWKNIEDAVKRKGNCQLSVQCVVLPENEHEAQDLYFRAAEAGADLVIFKPYSQAKNDHGKAYENYTPKAEVRRVPNGPALVVRDAAPSHEKQPYTRCPSTPFMWAYIAADGDVYACSAHLLDPRFVIGNVNEKSFSEIWEGEERRRVYEMMKDFDVSECRKNCRMHATNVYLNDLTRGVPYRNFL